MLVMRNTSQCKCCVMKSSYSGRLSAHSEELRIRNKGVLIKLINLFHVLNIVPYPKYHITRVHNLQYSPLTHKSAPLSS